MGGYTSVLRAIRSIDVQICKGRSRWPLFKMTVDSLELGNVVARAIKRACSPQPDTPWAFLQGAPPPSVLVEHVKAISADLIVFYSWNVCRDTDVPVKSFSVKAAPLPVSVGLWAHSHSVSVVASERLTAYNACAGNTC